MMIERGVMAMGFPDYNKLFVTYMPPVTVFRPVYGRKYTLIQSESKEKTLYIGSRFYTKKLDSNELTVILAEWIPKMGQFVLSLNVFVPDKSKAEITCANPDSLQKHVNSALKMILHVDQLFFLHFPWLLDSPIHIQLETLKSPDIGTLRNYSSSPINERQSRAIPI